jgi:hypothetical protein
MCLYVCSALQVLAGLENISTTGRRKRKEGRKEGGKIIEKKGRRVNRGKGRKMERKELS